MQTFLIVLAGLLVGSLLLRGFGVAWLRRKIGDVCDSLMQQMQAGGIPPFRIHLVSNDEVEWSEPAAMEAATREFASMGYGRVGDYEILEMESVRIRAFWHARSGFFAVLYDHTDAGLFADVFRDFADGTSITVSTAPETGMDRPMHAPLFRIEEDVCQDGTVTALHDRLAHEAIGREGYEWSSGDFPKVFTEVYSQEMDWRIARGGVSRSEIERIAALSGNPPPSDVQVEMIRDMWECAISSFIVEEVQQAWLADSGLTAVDWERMRDRIIVVHDHGRGEDWIDLLAWECAEAGADASDDIAMEHAFEEAKDRIKLLFESGSSRNGFASAQSLLPEKSRHERVGSVEDPWPADVWVAPEDTAL